MSLLKVIHDKAKNTASLLLNFVMNRKPISRLIIFSHLVFKKLVIILVILCKLTYWNNNNNFSLLFILYLYFASAKIDVIILLNYLQLLVLYKMLLKKMRNITKASTAEIKAQGSNYKLVKLWNKFEYWENITQK